MAAMGLHSNLKEVHRIVEDCMENVHFILLYQGIGDQTQIGENRESQEREGGKG